jgi:small subunit ribosomal protein S6
MPLYEHVFLARQDITAQQAATLQKTYQTVIEENGGKVGKVEYWGLKSLSYKIKKNRKAHYSLMNLDAPPAAVAEMERQMSLSTDVIRFITIRVKEHDDKQSAMMKRSDDRDRDRGDRGDRGDRRGPRREGGGGGGFRGDREGGGGGFRGDREGGGGGGFRGDREGGGGGGFRGDREGGGGGGFRGDREGGARFNRNETPSSDGENS